MDVLLSEWRKMSVGGKVARVVSWVVYLAVAVVAWVISLWWFGRDVDRAMR